MSDIIGLVARDGTKVEIRRAVINKFDWFSAMMTNETRQGQDPKVNFFLETDAFTCRKMVQWMNHETNNVVAPFVNFNTNIFRELTDRENVILADVRDEVIVELTYSAHFYQLQKLENLLIVGITYKIQTFSITAVRNMFNITDHGFNENEENRLVFELECAQRLLQN